VFNNFFVYTLHVDTSRGSTCYRYLSLSHVEIYRKQMLYWSDARSGSQYIMLYDGCEFNHRSPDEKCDFYYVPTPITINIVPINAALSESISFA